MTATNDPVTKWKALARKHEQRWRDMSDERDRLRSERDQYRATIDQLGGPDTAAQLANLLGPLDDATTIDQLVTTARHAGAADAYHACATRLAHAELRAAGIPADIVADIDLTRLLTTDPHGHTTPDLERIATVADKVLGRHRPGE